jgi:hypothetical protein
MNEPDLPKDYRLKKAQKCHIEQLRTMRIPDAQVAEMTGHSLGTFHKRYVKHKTYRRLDRSDFEEFGTLCENGTHWLSEWRGQTVQVPVRSEGVPASEAEALGPAPE